MIVFLKRMAAIERAAMLLESLHSSLTTLFTKRIYSRLVIQKILPGLHVCTALCFLQRPSGSFSLINWVKFVIGKVCLPICWVFSRKMAKFGKVSIAEFAF